MRVRLGDVQVVGGMQPAQGGSAFARARVVVLGTEAATGRFIVRRFPTADSFEGDPATEEEWRGLLASGDAMELAAPVPAAASVALWLLRANFSFRDGAERDLKSKGALLHGESVLGTRVLLVREPEAGLLRDLWGDRAFNRAWQAAQRGELPEAIEEAELAMDLARGLVDDRTALVCLLYDRAGDKARSEAYMEMARNSKGEAFYLRIGEKKDRFAKECAAEGPSGRSKLLPGIRAARRGAIVESFAVFPNPSKAA
jgi:hypothetical protein